MMSHVAMNAGLAHFMKSIFVPLMMWSMFKVLIMFLASIQSKINRVTTNAVNKLAATPMVSATPKPLTEPVPMTISTMDEINVVMCESKIVLNARS